MPNPTLSLVVRYKDGDKTNIRADNLEWSNEKTKKPSKLGDNADVNPNRNPNINPKMGKKLLAAQVDEIRYGYSNGKKVSALAKEYNVSRACVDMIVKNKRWIIKT